MYYLTDNWRNTQGINLITTILFCTLIQYHVRNKIIDNIPILILFFFNGKVKKNHVVSLRLYNDQLLKCSIINYYITTCRILMKKTHREV